MQYQTKFSDSISDPNVSLQPHWVHQVNHRVPWPYHPVLGQTNQKLFQGGFFPGSWNKGYDYIYDIDHYHNNKHYDDIKHLDNDYHNSDQKLQLLKDHNKDNCDGQEHYHDHRDFFLRDFFPGDFFPGDFFLGDIFLGDF